MTGCPFVMSLESEKSFFKIADLLFVLYFFLSITDASGIVVIHNWLFLIFTIFQVIFSFIKLILLELFP